MPFSHIHIYRKDRSVGEPIAIDRYPPHTRMRMLASAYEEAAKTGGFVTTRAFADNSVSPGAGYLSGDMRELWATDSDVRGEVLFLGCYPVNALSGFSGPVNAEAARFAEFIQRFAHIAVTYLSVDGKFNNVRYVWSEGNALYVKPSGAQLPSLPYPAPTLPQNQAAQSVEDSLQERVAQALYATWSSTEGYVPWVIGGNSERQDDARTTARRVLVLLQQGRDFGSVPTHLQAAYKIAVAVGGVKVPPHAPVFAPAAQQAPAPVPAPAPTAPPPPWMTATKVYRATDTQAPIAIRTDMSFSKLVALFKAEPADEAFILISGDSVAFIPQKVLYKTAVRNFRLYWHGSTGTLEYDEIAEAESGCLQIEHETGGDYKIVNARIVPAEDDAEYVAP